MKSLTVQLSSVKILRTGADGGHIYIKGRGVVPGKGDSDIYAYFTNKEHERDFERRFAGQVVLIEANEVQFTPGQGGAIREVLSWRFA